MATCDSASRSDDYSLIIAIDGPAGSGKSSTAKAVARQLRFEYLDTGAMYRAVALHLFRSGLRRDVEETDPRVGDLLDLLELDLSRDGDRTKVVVNGEDVTEEIRSPEVGSMASWVSRLTVVRERIVDLQRKVVAVMIERSPGVVVEGRDIGTVVFPSAALKVFMVASDEVRAHRRRDELAGTGIDAPLETVLGEIRDRDARDMGRMHSPLRRAEGSLLIDTSDLTFDEQVRRIVEAAQKVHAPRRR
jgi:cytidylate kinase